MATSRTGTGEWKRRRLKVLHRAQADGLTHCPMMGCGVPLDYEVGRRPNSAEVDHEVPYAMSGENPVDGLRVICRRCNQRLGAKFKNDRYAKRVPVETIEF